MSLSNAARRENVRRSLRLLMAEVGERWIKMALIDLHSDPYKSVDETTWVDLRNQDLIQDAEAGSVHLTGQGWEEGLRLMGQDNPDTRARVVRIYQGLRTIVAGRSGPALVAPVRLGDVAGATSLQSVFIANVIEARLIERWLNRRSATWAAGFEGRMSLVPPDFGEEIP